MGEKPSERGSISPRGPNEAPLVRDRGLRAWLQVLAAWMIFFSAGGTANTYGAYQAFYQSDHGLPESASTISWIGSTQAFLILGLGPVSGSLYDRGYYRVLLWTGSFLLMLGQMMLSLCTVYYQVFLAQGICMGLGGGLIFSPGATRLAAYFDRRFNLAMGLAATGASVGGLLLPILLNQTIGSIGFAWATRACGLALAVTLGIALLLAQPAAPSNEAGVQTLISWPSRHETAYLTFLAAIIITTMAIYVPSFYLQAYSSTSHLLSDTLTAYILPMFTGFNAIGCIIANALAQPLDVLQVLVAAVLVAGALAFSLVNLSHGAGLIAYTVLAGIFTAAAYSLPPTCFVALSPSPAVVGARVGMGYACMAVGGLVGPPMAGAVLDRYGFNALWVMAGSVSIAGAAVAALSCRIHSQGRNCYPTTCTATSHE